MENSPQNVVYFIMLDWLATRHMAWDFLLASTEKEILVFPRLAIATKVGNEYLKEWEENHVVNLN